MLAKSLGGSELLQVFRTLGDFLRQDLAVRKEIEIKHGWIKSSAHLSSAAPWLLLLLLSSQPATARAFNQPSGAAILMIGLILTGVAYFWMGQLGNPPASPPVRGVVAGPGLADPPIAQVGDLRTRQLPVQDATRDALRQRAGDHRREQREDVDPEGHDSGSGGSPPGGWERRRC